MDFDLIIRCGQVIHTEDGAIRREDIAVKGERSACIAPEIKGSADLELDAGGCFVMPGLIDYHAHLFHGGSDFGVLCDAVSIPNGVTTAVDAGTSGVSNYEVFRMSTMRSSLTRVKAFLSVCSMGMVHTKIHENLAPEHFEEERMKDLFQKYPCELKGVKLRFSRDFVPGGDRKALQRALEIAENIGTRLIVHVTDPAIDIEELAMALRPGDIFCHVYQGRGQTVLDDNGKVLEGIRKAREKGVLFDACNGKMNFDSDVAAGAVKDGFLPDIISSDLTAITFFRQPVISLPFVMSKYLALGMKLEDIVRCCTETPAKLLGLGEEIGFLRTGYRADIAVFRIREKNVRFIDENRKVIEGKQILIPQLTVKDGKILYRQNDF